MFSDDLGVAKRIRCYRLERGELIFHQRLAALSSEAKNLFHMIEADLSADDIVIHLARARDGPGSTRIPSDDELVTAKDKFVKLIGEVRAMMGV